MLTRLSVVIISQYMKISNHNVVHLKLTCQICLNNIRDVGSIPALGRFPGGGHGNPLQYFAWRIPWTEEPGGLQFIDHKELDMTEATHTHSD